MGRSNYLTDADILGPTKGGPNTRVRKLYVAEVYLRNAQTARAIEHDPVAFSVPSDWSIGSVIEGPDETTMEFTSDEPFASLTLNEMVSKFIEVDRAFSNIKRETEPHTSNEGDKDDVLP